MTNFTKDQECKQRISQMINQLEKRDVSDFTYAEFLIPKEELGIIIRALKKELVDN